MVWTNIAHYYALLEFPPFNPLSLPGDGDELPTEHEDDVEGGAGGSCHDSGPGLPLCSTLL